MYKRLIQAKAYLAHTMLIEIAIALLFVLRDLLPPESLSFSFPHWIPIYRDSNWSTYPIWFRKFNADQIQGLPIGLLFPLGLEYYFRDWYWDSSYVDSSTAVSDDPSLKVQPSQRRGQTGQRCRWIGSIQLEETRTWPLTRPTTRICAATSFSRSHQPEEAVLFSSI